MYLLTAKADEVGAWRAERARAGRAKTVPARIIAQGIAELAKDWDGIQHFKKAGQIHVAINAKLRKAWEENGRKGAPWTISQERLAITPEGVKIKKSDPYVPH